MAACALDCGCKRKRDTAFGKDLQRGSESSARAGAVRIACPPKAAWRWRFPPQSKVSLTPPTADEKHLAPRKQKAGKQEFVPLPGQIPMHAAGACVLRLRLLARLARESLGLQSGEDFLRIEVTLDLE